MPSVRQTVRQRLIVDGLPYVVSLISNPTIEDVVVTEMRIQAAAIEGRPALLEDRIVQRDIKDFLIRLGVER